MKLMRALGLVFGLMAVSGCATLQVSREVNRLQSQVALLDERLTQLERVSTRGESVPAAIHGDLLEAVPSLSKASLPATDVSADAAPPAIKPSTREIQQALQNAGFYQGKADGKRGPLTREAIREFQRMHELKVDGVVGKRTWAQLSIYGDSSLASGELGAAEILK